MSVSVNFMLENYCSNNCDEIIKWFIDNARAYYSDEVKNLKITLIKTNRYHENVFELSFQLNPENVPLNHETAFTITEGILNPIDLSDYPDERNNNLRVAYMVEGSFVFTPPQRSPSTASTRKQTPRKYPRCQKGSRRNKKTGECVKTNPSFSYTPEWMPPKRRPSKMRINSPDGEAEWQDVPYVPKKKRCKKGTRKDRKTGLCVPYLRPNWDNIRQASLTSAEKRDAHELFQRQVQAAQNVMRKMDDKKKAEDYVRQLRDL